jgi:AcrR family transcriptional regulator
MAGHAAIDMFAEKAFASTKLDDVAERAGVAKGTLYRHWDTRESLFRAVLQQTLATHLSDIETAPLAFRGSLAQFVPMLLKRAANRMGNDRLPAVARMVLSERRVFPDLASPWHDE